ncbi:hypothetical protein [Pseudomonas songnenensis]|uniref:HAD family hydrolase n=1 Tax=Pseudomonas songnenensis TaxID=1176259 RepID=UPI0030F39DA3
MDVRVGVCSNLAYPYREAVLRCYPDLDAYAFSCDLGVMKPDPAIYRWSCNQLGAEPGATWMLQRAPRSKACRHLQKPSRGNPSSEVLFPG